MLLKKAGKIKLNGKWDNKIMAKFESECNS
jgi:hypothetical protein